MDFLFRIALILMNITISIYFGTLEFLRRLKDQISRAKYSSGAEELFENLRKFFKFDKIPGHVGVVVNEEIVSYVDLANIIVWCLALGIRNVSIYDIRGTMKLNRFTLYKESTAAKKRILKANQQNHKILLYSNSVKEDFENGFQNGRKWNDESINVSLLCWENGKIGVVNAAKTMCQEAKKEINTTLGSDQIDFGEHLKCSPTFTDPDVTVCFGGGQTLAGYLPWHIRLTEFTFHQTLYNFRLMELMRVFEVYNKCEQRVGK